MHEVRDDQRAVRQLGQPQRIVQRVVGVLAEIGAAQHFLEVMRHRGSSGNGTLVDWTLFPI
jgi:hypothetical protein